MTAGPVIQTLPTQRITQNALRANMDHGFIYLNNPKVGCSTIKAALWTGATGEGPRLTGQRVHAAEGSPFTSRPQDADAVARAFVFTFVRNPFQRVVSAYLNKVAVQRGTEWQVFARRHGLQAGGEVSFDAFVEGLSGVPAELHDPHWRPQHLNTLHPFVQPNLRADLEHLDRLLPEVLARVFPGRQMAVPGPSQRRHATAARRNWRSLLTDPASRARVVDIYAGDFAGFGYAPDVAADPAPCEPVQWSDHGHEGLAALVRYWQAAGPDKAGRLRAVERADGPGALRAWVLAQRLRLIARNRERVAQMLAERAEEIAAGPYYLRRVAEEVRSGAVVAEE